MALEDQKKRYSLTPNRSYLIPGGPHAEDLGEREVKILAEFKRGSEEDGGVGNRR